MLVSEIHSEELKNKDVPCQPSRSSRKGDLLYPMLLQPRLSWHRAAGTDPASCFAAQVTFTSDSHLLPPPLPVKLSLSEDLKEEGEREKEGEGGQPLNPEARPTKMKVNSC